MEPSFDRPDAYYAIPEEDRPARTLAGKSDCRIRDLADTERRYFLRVLLPIAIVVGSSPTALTRCKMMKCGSLLEWTAADFGGRLCFRG
jgi:hypothetical protein